MVVAESLAVFAVAKKTIEVVSSAVDTAENATSLYSGLDKLFRVKDQVEREVTKKKPAKPRSKLHALFTKVTKEDGDDDLSVGAVAAMVLEQKKLDRKIENLGIRIDNKFGEGTWSEILETREKMLAERKEKKRKAKKLAQKQEEKNEEIWNKVWKIFIEILKLSIVLISAFGVGYLIWINRCMSGNC